MSEHMNTRIYLAFAPNIMRRIREDITVKFPEAKLDAPNIHSEMFSFASEFGQGPIPGLTVSAYPQVVLHASALAAAGRFAKPDASLPPLRDEFVKIGMTPPVDELRIVGIVPGILAASSSLSHKLEDWADLCDPDFPGPIGCLPADTPFPYLIEAVFRDIAGDSAENLFGKLDIKSNPLDINKRIASGELTASLIIPAFARTFRSGSGSMVWPKSGALAIPLMACLAADAAPVAHEILAYLLSEEFQRVVLWDGVIAPVIPGVPGFEELEENGWNFFWPGWDCFCSVADTMYKITLRK